jgi:hypothetical protein
VTEIASANDIGALIPLYDDNARRVVLEQQQDAGKLWRPPLAASVPPRLTDLSWAPSFRSVSELYGRASKARSLS